MRIKQWARDIKRDVVALYIAGRDPRTPWYAKGVALAVVMYALSPIDLIPDFIPILGYLDDLFIVPLGILLAVYLIPTELMAEFRHAASERGRMPTHWLGAAFIVGVWSVSLLAIGGGPTIVFGKHRALILRVDPTSPYFTGSPTPCGQARAGRKRCRRAKARS